MKPRLNIIITAFLPAALLLPAVIPPAAGQTNDAGAISLSPDMSGGMSFGLGAGAFLPYAAGDFRTGCDCSYSELSGAGVTFGAIMEYALSPSLSFGLRTVYQGMMPAYKKGFEKIRYAPSGEQLSIAYERKAEMSIHSINFTTSVQWRSGLGGLLLGAGPMLAYSFSVSFKETERVVTPGYVDYPSQTNMITLHDGRVDDALSYRFLSFNLHLTAGYELRLSEDYTLVPELGYTFPLTGLSEDWPSWKIPALHAGVSILLRL